ncbi:hypothetical protein GWI33_021730 [Rhynchophorus ferrugineus]|uniref:Uncharacterized protein n=1 Tax=Rhynchophorus ferrugineus TaxID=354439 RepID=A0A834IRL6_RHYFE|nr:hypothetical protein GWI33_021730 [Rhynchophorus ferrugineus]
MSIVIKKNSVNKYQALCTSLGGKSKTSEEMCAVIVSVTERKVMTNIRETKPDSTMQYFIDVPESWGIAADGSVMELFNKTHIEDT